MQISSVPDRCCGSGVCVELSPDLFDLDDDGFVVVLQEAPPTDLEQVARDVAAKCPTMAIVVED